MRLFRNALSGRMRDLVREEIGIAASDQSVVKLVHSLDKDYASQSFASLWSNYRHNKILLISANGEIEAESVESQTYFLNRPLDDVPGTMAVSDKLKELYKRNRVRMGDGFGYRPLQGVDPSEYAIMGFIRIDGKPAMFGAMPIVPDQYTTTLPDEPPTILLSALHIDETLLTQLNSQLKFTSFAFVDGETLPQKGPYHLIAGQNGAPMGVFKWEGQTVGGSIWPTIVPVIAVLSVALAALAFGIAWRIGQLTSSLQASEKQNRYLALHDTLTGLANRLQFNRALDAAIDTLSSRPFAMFHCDLDRFKAVNDTFGHGAGDVVLKAMASRLQKAVGKSGLVCRIGGDEFMILYHGPVDRENLQILCVALVDSGRFPVPLSDGDVAKVGLSIGVSVAPDDGETGEQIVTRADAALYEAKNTGRNRYAFYDDISTSGSGAAGSRQGSGGPVALSRAEQAG